MVEFRTIEHIDDKYPDQIDVNDGVPAKVEVKDFFHAKELMEVLHDWLVHNGWGPAPDYEFPEVFYHHIFFQNGAEEVRWWWRNEVDPPGQGKGGFFRYQINTSVRINNLKGAEVMKRGMKIKTNVGDVEVAMRGKLILDPYKTWKNHWLLKNFWHFWIHRMYNAQIERQKAHLRREVNRYKDAVRAYFKLPTVRPETEGSAGYEYNKDFE
ncbi:hypothetical protein H6504_00550 [Candidatus Woesearchaeota archaeon]|nr:hypothetical protein [Candidatus Woesearchaeota archaeon]